MKKFSIKFIILLLIAITAVTAPCVSTVNDKNSVITVVYADSNDDSSGFGLLSKLKNFFTSIYETIVEQLADMKERGPVTTVTTLSYGSSSYAVSSYAGESAALAAIENCRNSQYLWGGTNPNIGIDCSGLVYYSYNAIGYTSIARTSKALREQCQVLEQFWTFDEWYEGRSAGDLILMSGHVAMYIGTVENMRAYGVSEDIIQDEGLVEGVEYCIEAVRINADGWGDGVKITTLESNINDSRFLGCGRPYQSASSSGLTGDVQSLYNYFISAGMTPIGASGLIGNLLAETTTLNPNATNSSGYYGLAQWSKSRKADLISYCSSAGYDYTTVEGQCAFIVYEMRTKYSGLWTHLQSCPSVSYAAQDIALIYEGCIYGSTTYAGDYSNSTAKLQALPTRIQNALNVYSQCAN